MVGFFHAGAVAGVAAGIAATAARAIEVALNLPTAVFFPGFLRFDVVISHLVTEVGLNAIFGAVFGLVYLRFYDRLPGRGIKKGFVFGMLIYLVSNIHVAFYDLLYGLSGALLGLPGAGVYAYIGFPTLAAYDKS